MPKQVYSASRLSTYESCPRQYRFRYIDRIPRTEESIEAYLGIRVHEVLHKLYRDLQPGEDPSLADLLNDYHWQWGQHWHDQVKIVKRDRSVDHYKQFGERCLVNYYQAHKPFNHGQVLGLECQVATFLDPQGCYKVQGYIDRLVSVGSGRYEIHDYKTSGRLPSQEEIDVDRQLALYQLAVEGMWPDAKEVELVWHYLAFGRELRSRRTPKALKGLKSSTIAIIERIEADAEFKPIRSSLCHWCTYQNICPLWGGRAVTAEKSSECQVPGSKFRTWKWEPETQHYRAELGTGNLELHNGRSMEVQTSAERGGLDLQSISRDALREAIMVAAEREGAEIRFTEHGHLWIGAGQLQPRANLDDTVDGWVRLFADSLPLLFRQVELARLSASFVEKLQRYLAL